MLPLATCERRLGTSFTFIKKHIHCFKMAATHSSSPQRLSPDTDSDVIPTEAHLTHEKGKEEIDMKGPLKNADEDMPDKKNHVPSDDHFKSPSLPTPLSLSSTQPKKGRNDKTQISHVGNQNQVPAEFQDTQKTTPTSTGNAQVSIPYEEPKWSGIAEATYSFDVLKNGSIIGSVPLASKAFYVFGRLPSCDVSLEHPSLSRYHAVMQYSVTSTPTHEKGWYIYDLDSTHGTWLNKRKILPKVYHRVKVGHIVKFGGSSRLHILQGPSDDTEEESEMTITEMKAQKEKLQKETELLRQVELQEEMQRREAERKLLEDRGCAWGMGEDAEDMEDENPYASMVAENESLYIDDPKKALKGFYEREGCDLPDYQFTEVALGKHKCRVDLPVDGPNGEELVAEAVVSGKRKDAVVACALEACRILDKLGMLRSSTHESRKRKQKKWEDDDFYDSDEDTFLDRTGTIEKKRFMRMKKAGKDEAETYESLLEKYNTVAEQIQDIEDKLQKAKAEAEAIASEEMDELDAYMISIKSGVMDTKTRMQLKGNLLRLKGEEQKLRKLVNVAKPASLPPLKPIVPTPVAASPIPSSDSLSRKLHSHQKQLKKVTPVKIQAPVIEMKPDDFEEEDDDDEESSKNHKQEKLPALSEKQNSQAEAPSVTKRPDRTESKSEKIERPQSSETAMKGPSLPPAHVDTQSQGKKTVKPHHLSTAALLNSLDKNSGKKTKSASDPNYENSADPEYAMWLPPTEQSGDGRTSLNDKLGY